MIQNQFLKQRFCEFSKQFPIKIELFIKLEMKGAMIKVKGKMYQLDDCVTLKWSQNHSKDNNENTKITSLWGLKIKVGQTMKQTKSSKNEMKYAIF